MSDRTSPIRVNHVGGAGEGARDQIRGDRAFSLSPRKGSARYSPRNGPR